MRSDVEPGGPGEGRELSDARRRAPFGTSRSERWWRWLAGAAGAAALVGGGLVMWLPVAAAIAVIGCLVVGLPSVWALERWRPSHRPIGRYALVAPLATLVVFATMEFLAAGAGDGVWLFAAIYAAPFAVLSGALAAAIASRTPWRLVRGVAILASVIALVGVPLGIWLSERPPAPDDFVVVDATPAVITTFVDASGLAQAVAAGFDEVAADGRARLDQDTWIEVAEQLLPPERFGDTGQWTRFRQPHELPIDARTGQPHRRITVIVDGLDEACVLVSPDRTEVFPSACRALPRASGPGGAHDERA